ncbi:hypothetical protein MCI_00885 [Rickettsia montanensis str. OSU 85-930]|uniref:Uncharacterized protein n=1 Tax=Rickettsia montanensis (strain OSU 85-930) TaxID=1105114 RepID=H8KAS1_RICMS|nr:hypothetical protein MCI_00885 [Rickettsia montanensis str. OSU 85-930]
MKNESVKNIRLTTATVADYPLIQNMARFYIFLYIYGISRYCGGLNQMNMIGHCHEMVYMKLMITKNIL